MDDEDQSGLFDYEQQQFEEEQALLQADAAFETWLDSLELTQEHDND